MIEPGSGYLALGSSFAAGPGIAPIVHRGAARSGHNYAHQVAETLGLRLVDVTSSGATTANLRSVPQRTARGQLPPQLSALPADARLVTITAGGNDLGFIGGLLKHSVINTLTDRVTFLPDRVKSWLRPAIDRPIRTEGFDSVAVSLADVAYRVRERAPEARVVLVDYLPLFGPDTQSLPLSAGQLGWATEMADGLADAFRRAAEDSGADLLAVSAAGRDHTIGSPEPWVTGFSLRGLARGQVPYHPNLAGMSATADLLVELLAR